MRSYKILECGNPDWQYHVSVREGGDLEIRLFTRDKDGKRYHSTNVGVFIEPTLWEDLRDELSFLLSRDDLEDKQPEDIQTQRDIIVPGVRLR